MAAEPLPTTLLEDSIANWWRPLMVDLGELAVNGRGSRRLGDGEPQAPVSIAMQACREALARRAVGRG
jgi:hypothetical protein